MKEPIKMANETPSYYAIIPANVRYDNTLKANEKLMYGEITCLSQSTGNCFASNDYFARLYNVSKETISRWISNLKKQGYVSTKITYKSDCKTIDKRIITLLTKKSIPSCEKDQYPIDKKVKDNNTSNNNTRDNKESEEATIDYNFYLVAWNRLADQSSVSRIMKLTTTRKNKIKTRIDGAKDFKQVFIECLKKINNSRFCLGENNRDWKADFDWLIENDNNYVKILEGKYDDK